MNAAASYAGDIDPETVNHFSNANYDSYGEAQEFCVVAV